MASAICIGNKLSTCEGVQCEGNDNLLKIYYGFKFRYIYGYSIKY